MPDRHATRKGDAMFPSSADYARRHQGRIAMLALGAAIALAMAAAIDVPPVKAVDTDVAGIFGRLSNGPAPDPRGPLIGQRLAEVLDRVDDGRTVVWRDPQTRATYHIQPLATFTTGDRPCRTFTVRRTDDGSLSESYRTACQGADGVWALATAPRPHPVPCRNPLSPPEGVGEQPCPSP